jgi:hypothetical protein
MARPPVGAAKDTQFVVRLSTELRNSLERVREALSKRAGGVDLVISQLVREGLERGLDSLERELEAGSSGPRRRAGSNPSAGFMLRQRFTAGGALNPRF